MKASTGMDSDDFLTLFVTQLQNQDPLNPQDSSQFISQLAQLTQVQQAYNTNTNLQTLIAQGTNAATLSTTGLIGGTVQAPGSQVSLTAGSSTSINFSLASAANQVSVSIQDSTGATVDTITAGATAAGQGSVTWAGTDSSGNQLASGNYTFTVAAQDASGNAVTTSPLIMGTVTGVDMSGATPMLKIGTMEVDLTTVTTVTNGT
jgi:flagellar basal-body rod modification protein FlgD